MMFEIQVWRENVIGFLEFLATLFYAVYCILLQQITSFQTAIKTPVSHIWNNQQDAYWNKNDFMTTMSKRKLPRKHANKVSQQFPFSWELQSLKCCKILNQRWRHFVTQHKKNIFKRRKWQLTCGWCKKDQLK